MGDVWSLRAEHGVINLALSPEMAAHVRDAAYHVADDLAAIERYGEREAGLLGDLANELADVLDALGRVGDAREARRTRSAHDVPLRHIPHGVRVEGGRVRHRRDVPTPACGKGPGERGDARGARGDLDLAVRGSARATYQAKHAIRD